MSKALWYDTPKLVRLLEWPLSLKYPFSTVVTVLVSTPETPPEPAPDQPYLEVRATTASGDVTLHES